MNNQYMILTAIHEEMGLYIFSLKMRNEEGKFEPVRFWSYRSFAQANASREEILNIKFPTTHGNVLDFSAYKEDVVKAFNNHLENTVVKPQLRLVK